MCAHIRTSTLPSSPIYSMGNFRKDLFYHE
jgi:hypothetical protein